MKMMVVSLVLFLMAFTSATVEAGRIDPNAVLDEMFKENGVPNYFIKSTSNACCNECQCAQDKKWPPLCQCLDIGETCHSACKACLCTLSYPPQCRCFDTNTFCYNKCSSSSAKPKIA